MKVISILICLSTILSCKQSFTDRIERKLSMVIEMQKNAIKVSPIFENLRPVVVLQKNFMYKFDPNDDVYSYSGKAEAEGQYNGELRAALPIKEFGYKTMCLVTESVFDSEQEIVTIFHEFVHVHQFDTCEMKLKEKLKIYQSAKEKQDWMWELNHNFPYKESNFIRVYEQYLNFLMDENLQASMKCKSKLKEILNETDYEYLVWQEFKEGYARYLENLLKAELGIKENHYGFEQPYGRISFYESGSLLINLLVKENPSVKEGLENIYIKLKN